MLKSFWFRVSYGERSEIIVMTGRDVGEVANRIMRAESGRLRYKPRSPRITRLAAIVPPAVDAVFAKMIDEVLRIENIIAPDRT